MRINMEPAASEKKGAQNAKASDAAGYRRFMRLNEAAEGLIRIVDIAPELPGAAEFTKKAREFAPYP